MEDNKERVSKEERSKLNIVNIDLNIKEKRDEKSTKK
jgi:hypothetical protein